MAHQDGSAQVSGAPWLAPRRHFRVDRGGLRDRAPGSRIGHQVRERLHHVEHPTWGPVRPDPHAPGLLGDGQARPLLAGQPIPCRRCRPRAADVRSRGPAERELPPPPPHVRVIHLLKAEYVGIPDRDAVDEGPAERGLPGKEVTAAPDWGFRPVRARARRVGQSAQRQSGIRRLDVGHAGERRPELREGVEVIPPPRPRRLLDRPPTAARVVQFRRGRQDGRDRGRGHHTGRRRCGEDVPDVHQRIAQGPVVGPLGVGDRHLVVRHDRAVPEPLEHRPYSGHAVGMQFRRPEGAHARAADHLDAVGKETENLLVPDRNGLVEKTVNDQDRVAGRQCFAQEITVRHRWMDPRSAAEGSIWTRAAVSSQVSGLE